MNERIAEAIDRGPAKAAEIARFCAVTPQSVHKWKVNGRISKENLQMLSQITGYRYMWLLTGRGPKTFEHSDAPFNGIRESQAEYDMSIPNSPAYARLTEAVRFAIANRTLTEDAADHLAAFLTSIVEAKR